MPTVVKRSDVVHRRLYIYYKRIEPLRGCLLDREKYRVCLALRILAGISGGRVTGRFLLLPEGYAICVCVRVCVCVCIRVYRACYFPPPLPNALRIMSQLYIISLPVRETLCRVVVVVLRFLLLLLLLLLLYKQNLPHYPTPLHFAIFPPPTFTHTHTHTHISVRRIIYMAYVCELVREVWVESGWFMYSGKWLSDGVGGGGGGGGGPGWFIVSAARPPCASVTPVGGFWEK